MMGRGYGYGYNMMNGGYGWFGALMMLLIGALIVAGIALLVIWAVRSSAGHGTSGGASAPPPGAAGHDEAVALAKRRLASGEITKEQYEEIMRALGG